MRWTQCSPSSRMGVCRCYQPPGRLRQRFPSVNRKGNQRLLTLLILPGTTRRNEALRPGLRSQALDQELPPVLDVSPGVHAGLAGSRRRLRCRTSHQGSSGLARRTHAPLIRSHRDVHECRDAGLGAAQGRFPTGFTRPGSEATPGCVSSISRCRASISCW